MKRAFLFFTVLTLCLSCAVSTNAARMVQTFSTEYYQIFIPGDWVIDTSSRKDLYGSLDLGFMYSPDKTKLIEAKMNFYCEWAQVSLWSGSETLWQEYVAFLMNDLKDEEPKLLAKFSAGQYPGALIKGTNSYGSYLYGEIMINAYSYGFYFYLLNEDDTVNSNLTQEEVELFQSILETFTPVQPK